MSVCRSGLRRAHIVGRWISAPNSRPPARADERGSAAVELVLIAPVLVLLLVFVVFLGRLTQANAKVHHAADQAARTASMVSRGRAAEVAQATAASELRADGVVCASISVSSASSTTAGLEAIRVEVTCTIEVADLAPLVPGRRTITASSTEVIDVIRAVDE